MNKLPRKIGVMNVFIINVIEVLLSFLFTDIDTYIQNAHTYIRTYILYSYQEVRARWR